MEPNVKLGKLAARYLKGTPVLGNYTAELPPPPAAVDYSAAMHRLGIMVNDRTGDCTAAACGHSIQVWTSLQGSEVVLSDEAIIQFYSDTTGYVFGDRNTDNGAVASEVLAYWYKHPIAGHALAGFASVRPGNRTSIRDAIYLFGVCYLGVQLPLGVQNRDSWILPSGQEPTGNWEPGSWGGHAIPACAYDADTVTVISWGKLLKVDWEFLDIYMDEGYGLLSRDWLSGADNSPPGFNFAELTQDMNSLRVSP